MATQLFKKYYRRVAREGVLKALFCGLIVGSVALLIVAAATWFAAYKPGLWIALALFAVGLGVSAPLFYIYKFRPTTKAIAKRIDELGLEERLLTMTELENDDSFIAMKQREDALKALNSVDHMLIKVVVSASLIVALCVSCVFGMGMTTVSALYYADVIKSGKELFTPVEEPGIYTLSYKVSAGKGAIYYWNSDIDAEWQPVAEEEIVDEGEDGSAVIAIPEDGWVFVQWSDGVKNPYRQDKAVTADIEVTAQFEELTEEGLEDPVDEDEATNGGNGNQPNRGQEGNDGNQPSDQQRPPDNMQQGESSRDKSSDQVNDGKTNYGDVMGDSQSNFESGRGSDSSFSGDLKGGIEGYLGSLGGNGAGSGEGSGGGSGSGSGTGEGAGGGD